MAGRKRGAESESVPNTRSSKVAKTDSGTTAVKATKGGKKGAKTALPTTTFKAKALPLHVNLTHTPPSIADADIVPAAPEDPGFIGSLNLVPASFATGSYGWKGSKRISVELQNPEGGNEREKVQVMLTINATVVGSKGAKGDEEVEEETKPEVTHGAIANANDETGEDADANGDAEKPAGE